jgi:hypothetical protein
MALSIVMLDLDLRFRPGKASVSSSKLPLKQRVMDPLEHGVLAPVEVKFPTRGGNMRHLVAGGQGL